MYFTAVVSSTVFVSFSFAGSNVVVVTFYFPPLKTRGTLLHVDDGTGLRVAGMVGWLLLMVKHLFNRRKFDGP